MKFEASKRSNDAGFFFGFSGFALTQRCGSYGKWCRGIELLFFTFPRFLMVGRFLGRRRKREEKERKGEERSVNDIGRGMKEYESDGEDAVRMQWAYPFFCIRVITFFFQRPNDGDLTSRDDNRSSGYEWI
jgi:hypothetical protein